MALPTLAETKSYLRIETVAEDSVITDLLAVALAWAEALIGKPITAAARTLAGIRARYDEYGRSHFYLPIYPASSASLVITDSAGVTVNASTYALDSRTGRLSANTGESFGYGFYSVTATVGLSAHPDYATKIEPSVRALIIGLVSILYHQRNPNASSESENGVSVSYTNAPLPPHLDLIAKQLRGARIR